MTSGRVLSEEELQAIGRREYYDKPITVNGVLTTVHHSMIDNLIATIRDRDKKIEERDKTIDELYDKLHDRETDAALLEQCCLELQRENDRLRGALFETLKCYGDPFNMTVDEWINHFTSRQTLGEHS